MNELPKLRDLFGLYADSPIDVGAGWDEDEQVNAVRKLAAELSEVIDTHERKVKQMDVKLHVVVFAACTFGYVCGLFVRDFCEWRWNKRRK